MFKVPRSMVDIIPQLELLFESDGKDNPDFLKSQTFLTNYIKKVNTLQHKFAINHVLVIFLKDLISYSKMKVMSLDENFLQEGCIADPG